MRLSINPGTYDIHDSDTVFMAQISVFMDHCWVFIVTSLKPTIVRFVRLFIMTAVELL